MLHEALPPAERFAIGEAELEVLRGALESERREHGNLLVEAIRHGFASRGASGRALGQDVRVFHKPGYAYRWTSDVMFVQPPEGARYIIAIAGHPGRRVLDDALRHISRVLASDRLREVAARR
jgi:hypothetical protein